MKNALIKNLHLLIIAYALNGLFTIYTENEEKLENMKAQTPAIRAKIQKEKKNLAQIEDFKKDLAATKERVQEVVTQIEKAQKQLPADVNDAQVQEYLSKVSEDLKMKQPKQAPGEEENLGFYFAKKYNFQARGTFLQSLIFFETLAKAERILNVKEVKIKHIQDKVRGRFQIIDVDTTVESFRYNKNYKEKSGVEEIEKQFKVN